MAGDRRAWDELVERYSALVYSIPRRMGLRADECDDVAQTVFVILLRRLSTLRDHQSLAKWLITTTRRECLRTIRRRTAAGERVEPAGTEAEAPIEALERAHVVRKALRGLGDRCRRLLTLLFLTEPPPDYQAVSASLNMPIGSIGPTRARCLAQLMERLEADPEAAAAVGAFGADGP